MPPNATGQATEETQPANPPAVQQNSQPQQTSPFSKPSAAPSTPPRQMSQATTPPNPADQNAAANEPAGTQRTLPKTGSLLPIIAIVGLGATAAGLLSRK